LSCACGFSTVYDTGSFLSDLFSWPCVDSFSLCLDFSSVLLLITCKTPQPIFSCAMERLVPRRPRDLVLSYLLSRFAAPPLGFVFVEQSRSLCGKEKRPGNKPRHPHRRSYFHRQYPCRARLENACAQFSPAVFRFWFAVVDFSLELVTAAGFASQIPIACFSALGSFTPLFLLSR
jgi:hypothetical protein